MNGLAPVARAPLLEGGQGSGFHGHAGRPGAIGGSAKGKAEKAIQGQLYYFRKGLAAVGIHMTQAEARQHLEKGGPSTKRAFVAAKRIYKQKGAAGEGTKKIVLGKFAAAAPVAAPPAAPKPPSAPAAPVKAASPPAMVTPGPPKAASAPLVKSPGKQNAIEQDPVKRALIAAQHSAEKKAGPMPQPSLPMGSKLKAGVAKKVKAAEANFNKKVELFQQQAKAAGINIAKDKASLVLKNPQEFNYKHFRLAVQRAVMYRRQEEGAIAGGLHYAAAQAAQAAGFWEKRVQGRGVRFGLGTKTAIHPSAQPVAPVPKAAQAKPADDKKLDQIGRQLHAAGIHLTPDEVAKAAQAKAGWDKIMVDKARLGAAKRAEHAAMVAGGAGGRPIFQIDDVKRAARRAERAARIAARHAGYHKQGDSKKIEKGPPVHVPVLSFMQAGAAKKVAAGALKAAKAPVHHAPVPFAPKKAAVKAREEEGATVSKSNRTEDLDKTADKLGDMKWRADREAYMQTAPIAHIKEIKQEIGGCEPKYKLTFEDGSHALYKPGKGENSASRSGLHDGMLYKREVAGANVAVVIGIAENSTPVVERTIKLPEAGVYHGKEINGSVQHWVEDKNIVDAAYTGTPWRQGMAREDITKGAAFDLLLGHSDRHEKNWMLTHDGAKGNTKPILNDNGLSMEPGKHSDGTQIEWRSRLLKEAAVNDISLDTTKVRLKDKWDGIETAFKTAKIDTPSIERARERYDAIMNPENKTFSDAMRQVYGKHWENRYIG